MNNDKKVDVAAELAAEYREYLLENLPRMLDALVSERFDEAQRIAHKIKGNAPTFGYHELAEWAATVEQVCKEGGELDFIGLRNFVDNLLERLRSDG